MTALTFAARGLEVALAGRHVLGPLDLDVPRGSFIGILGPNGSGKTTLLRALAGTVDICAGTVLLEGEPLEQYSTAALAKARGVVPQTFSLDFSFTLGEMVAMGRYARDESYFPSARAGRLRSRRTKTSRPHGHEATDHPSVAAALEHTGLSDLADRLVTQLSGGERQRALIAQTLAQDTPTLLLDEPLNNLDLNHQLEVMQLLVRLQAEGRTLLVVLHDLNMAAQYCDRLLVLGDGRIMAQGGPSEILDPALVMDLFRVRVSVHREGRRPYVTPLWSRAAASLADSPRTGVHVMAGGGAASGLIEELVLQGLAPTVGIVSVFDTDFATGRQYELDVISSPPFEPFSAEAVRELRAATAAAAVVVIAPIFFGQGNLELLRVAAAAQAEGKKILIIDSPPIHERDASGGLAGDMLRELLESGATPFSSAAQAVEWLRYSSL